MAVSSSPPARPAPLNPAVTAIEAPPIAAAWQWLEGVVPRPDQPLIDLCQAVPGYPPADTLAQHLAALALDPAMARYTPIDGIAPLRAALAERTAALYGGAVDPGQVLISAGCNQAFYLAVLALAGPGDNIILPVPWYFNHRMILDLHGIEVRPLPCRPDHGMVPDPDQAAALIDRRTKALVLVSPNNPTGALYPAAVLDRFFDLAADRGIRLVLDETYRDFPDWPAGRPHALFTRPAWPQTLVHLYSFSKVFCLAGYRVGAVVAAAELLAELAKIMDCLAICAPHIGQRAALFGLQALGPWVTEKRAVMAERTAAFRSALAAAGTGYRIASLGAYFAYVHHPFSGMPSTEVAQSLARRHQVLCLPGAMFGPGQEDCLRFAFANVAAERMPVVAARLAASEAGTGV